MAKNYRFFVPSDERVCWVRYNVKHVTRIQQKISEITLWRDAAKHQNDNTPLAAALIAIVNNSTKA